MAVGSLMSDDSLHSVYLIWCVCGNKTVCELGEGERSFHSSLRELEVGQIQELGVLTDLRCRIRKEIM